MMALNHNPTFDILGLGAVAVDELLYVAAYPPPDAKTPVLRRERQCGGLTATALVAASRLGAACAYAGVLGDDDLSSFVLDCLSQEGVDVTHVLPQAEARPVHSVIIVDQSRHTRNIFFDYQGVAGAGDTWPPAEVIGSARVLFVDHMGMAGMLRAARLARAAGIPIVADLERDEAPHFAELLSLVDHLIISLDFAAWLTGQVDPALAVEALWRAGPEREAVIITCGEAGSWYTAGSLAGSPRHQPAYQVQAVDTTGCGDVFHGAYAAALARGFDLPARLRLASAAAALKATQPGGQAGIPTWAAVETFLREDD